MEFVHLLELTLTTLLVTNVIPFLYFIYHTSYWYDPRKLQRLDVLLMMVSMLAALFVGAKLVNLNRGGGREEIQMALLHLAPLVLTVILIADGRKKGRGTRGNKVPAKPGEGKDSSGFKPVSEKIERISWDDLVINVDLKRELLSVIDLLKDPRSAKQYGIDCPKGILLAGPPGNGKTTIAKVMAKNAGLAFFALRADEVISKWVGESEKNLTALFAAANSHKPAVIFIDEVDSIGKARGHGQSWADNLLNHLLQLVDGVIKQEGLYIIAATNRPDLVDDALKRPGRLDKVFTIPQPDLQSRMTLFRLFLSKLKLAEDVDLESLAYVTDGRSGADIKGICNQAGLNAYKRESGTKKRDYLVTYDDIELALNEFLAQKSAKR